MWYWIKIVCLCIAGSYLLVAGVQCYVDYQREKARLEEFQEKLSQQDYIESKRSEEE